LKQAWVVRSADWVRLFDHEPSDAEIVEAIRRDREPLSLLISICPSDKDSIENTRLVATVPFLLEHNLIDLEVARRHLNEVLKHRRPKGVRVTVSTD